MLASSPAPARAEVMRLSASASEFERPDITISEAFNLAFEIIDDASFLAFEIVSVAAFSASLIVRSTSFRVIKNTYGDVVDLK